ncbi:MAG: tmk [Candidatus Berkelbacteria bacterium]|nr:tmk [Candidatus Berkelbacteria bacterium]
MLNNRGKLIVIDGADGSGKKTQAELLINRLKKIKKKAVLVDFPQYDDFFGKIIRRYLDGEFGGLDDVSGYLASVLFAADRWRSKEKIEKYLQEGFIVISNRYAESNMAHQGAKIKSPDERKRYLDWLNEMEFETFKIPRADAIIYLDVPIEVSQKLMDGRGKKDIHEKNIQYLRNTQELYREFCKNNKNWFNIPCTKNDKLMSRENISELVWAVLLYNYWEYFLN